MHIWNTAIVLTKALFYIGFACIAGYAFLGYRLAKKTDASSGDTGVLNYTQLTAFLVITAVIANAVWFFASTGAMAEEGLKGAFDADMLSIMWDSSVGEATLMRTIGLTFGLMGIVVLRHLNSQKTTHFFGKGCLICGLLILSYSFTLVGHVSELDTIEKVLLALHVLIMAWWFGALYPLLRACKTLTDDSLYSLMEIFGRQASILVSVLLLAGLWLALKLVGSFEQLIISSYGQMLLLKLFLVTSIMGLAARHKLKLVPHIKNHNGKERLFTSILIEIVLAIAILLVTAGLTSLVGPEN